MKHKILRDLLYAGLLLALLSIAAFSQTAPTVVTGDVISVTDTKIMVKTSAGHVEAVLSAATVFKRVPPEKPSLKAATPAVLTDIGVGDKIAVTGILSTDGKTIPARSVYLMSKADIAEKNAKEAEQWRTRGITGRVASLDEQSKTITIETRTLTGSSTIVVTPASDARFLRYAPDSIRFDEAQVSAISEIKAGDMFRALGDRGTDGATFTAEQIVTGAFQTLAGTVKSVDAEKNEIVIRDLNSKKDLTILIGGASVLKRFPAEMAERMAGNQAAGGGRVRPAGAPVQPGAAPEGVRPGGAGGGRGGRAPGSIDEMIERFPDITAADLKVGDMIAISSTKNVSNDRIKAIKLLAGVEPFLRMAQSSGRRQGGQGVQGGFSIPGLDGIGFP
jgi:hypothetical protein